jgi:DNA polymerase
MRTIHDFETRSAVDPKTAGAWRYAADPSTDVMCLCLKPEGSREPMIWVPPWMAERLTPLVRLRSLDAEFSLNFISTEELQAHVNRTDVIWEAHNAEFERAIWSCVMTRYGFTPPPLERFECTAARAAAQNLPRKLEKVCQALRLPVQKDMEGHRLMLKLCKPRTPRTAEKEAYPNWADYLWWHEEPEELLRLIFYCKTDVDAEEAVSRVLYPLRPLERQIWLHDQMINQRGVPVDVYSTANIVATLGQYQEHLLAETSALTAGVVNSPRQTQATREWLSDQKVFSDNIQKDTVDDLMKMPLPENARRLLEIRQALAKASTGKFQAILDRVTLDHRCRSLLMYHGAGTGRWSAKAIQPHNMPRDCYQGDELENVLALFQTRNYETVMSQAGDPYFVASRCIRGMIRSDESHDLICSDFASIEAIAVAWVAGQQDVLDDFAAGKDLYIIDAQGIFGLPYEAIDKDQRQVGKVSTLALGFGGGIRAYGAMAQTYGVDLESLVPLIWPTTTQEEKKGAARMAAMFPLDETVASKEASQTCDVIKQRWRGKRPLIVALWAKLGEASASAVRDPGSVYSYRSVSFVASRDNAGNLFLICRLPSGRTLYYCEPRMQIIKAPWGKDTLQLTAMTVDSKTYQWVRRPISGALLTENVVQAMCRDLMAEALLRLEARGYPPILHVHDEIVSEIGVNHPGSVEEFEAIMSEVPDWARGLPVRAEGWRGKRYRK